jgi:salicylate hydroxylase/6-hydroxynicotinate 3-monooxygenase
VPERFKATLMPAKPKIAVLGAGMGGLAMAALLHRAGVDVTVFEQAKAFARVGAGIQMSPNALRVLRALDLEDHIRRVAFQPRYWRNRTWDTGEMQYELPLGAAAEERHGAPYLLGHRADLHAALLSRVPPDLIALDKQLTDLKQDGNGVTLKFADRTSATADILIAADGLHSRVRQILFGPEQPRFTGNVAYRTVFPTSLLGGLELDDNCKWWGPDRHIVTYYVNPRRDELYFVTSVPDPEWKLDSWSAMGDLGELRAAFEGFHADVTRVLAACPRVHKWALADRDPMPRWSEGRVMLMGDACHPMTPTMAQGAAQALEDAMIMARCLAQFGCEDIAGAWRCFEATRRMRTAQIQLTSHRNVWMRRETDGGWLYDYDACTSPLEGAEAQSAAE